MSDQANVQYDDGVPYDTETGEILDQVRSTLIDEIRAADAADEHPEVGIAPAEPEPGNDNPELPLGIPEHVEGESKADAFVRLAEHRVNTALKRIDMVANLANRSMYDFTPEQVAEVIGSLREAIEDAARRFRVNSPRPEFRLRR